MNNKWENIELNTNDFKEEEKEYIEQMDAAYKEYELLSNAYKQVILLEKDPQKKLILESLADDLGEDNK